MGAELQSSPLLRLCPIEGAGKPLDLSSILAAVPSFLPLSMLPCHHEVPTAKLPLPMAIIGNG
jgi:hypothetical protein